MRVLLINSPVRLDAKPSCIPYGLATIASTLRQEGYDVELYDINAFRPNRVQIVSHLKSTMWDVAGVSGLITTYEFQSWIIGVLKEINPHAPVISGGGLATTNSELLFKHSAVDISVIGEGEQTMADLCRSIDNGSSLSVITGLAYRQNGHFTVNDPRNIIPDLDTIPHPAWDLLPMDIYLANPIWGDIAGNSSGFRNDVRVKRSMNIISSRGCPFSCQYCYHLFGRSSYRFRTVENVICEIEILVDRYQVDFIGFVDDNMMASEKHVFEFCDALEKKGLPVTWGCHGRVSSAKPDVLNRMAETGCIWIGYGIESGSQKILNEMNKKTSTIQAREAIINTRKAGIFPNTTFIFGYPGETRDTIQETIDFKKDLGLECGSFFATPYPETPLYNRIKSCIHDEDEFVRSLGNATDFSINLTDFDDDTLFMFKKAMDENRDVI